MRCHFRGLASAPFLTECCDVPGPPPSQARSSSGQRRRSSAARVPLQNAAAAPPGPSAGPCPAPVQRESYGKEVPRKWGWEAKDNMCVAGKLCHLCDSTIRCQFLTPCPLFMCQPGMHCFHPADGEIKPLAKVLDVLQIEAEGLEAVHVRAAQVRSNVLQ